MKLKRSILKEDINNIILKFKGKFDSSQSMFLDLKNIIEIDFSYFLC